MNRHSSRRLKKFPRLQLGLAIVAFSAFILGVGLIASTATMTGNDAEVSEVLEVPPTVVDLPRDSARVPIETPELGDDKDADQGAAALADSFNDLVESTSGNIGVAIVPVGDAEQAALFGQWKSGPAWSTSKVPLTLAVLRERADSGVTGQMEAAIVRSDNPAAEALWSQLGDPGTAARKMEVVLREAGDSTIVQSQVIRPGFTAFGQTEWSIESQARFLARIACDERSAPVLDLMGRIRSDQSWGIGALPGARFKGGWGPTQNGGYLVRQFGLVTTANGVVAIAMATESASSSFGDGVDDLNNIASWIAEHLPDFAAGTC